MDTVLVHTRAGNRFFQLETYTYKKRKYDALTYLVKNWILSLEASASKLNNLLVSARFLAAKLVAWESKDLKTCGHRKFNMSSISKS
jgi:hypothetical protein